MTRPRDGALFYRAFLLESFDPAYLQSASGRKAVVVQQGFLLLVSVLAHSNRVHISAGSEEF